MRRRLNSGEWREVGRRQTLYRYGALVHACIGRSAYHGHQCGDCVNVFHCRLTKRVADNLDYCITGLGFLSMTRMKYGIHQTT